MDINEFLSIVRRAFPGLTTEQEERFAALDGLYRDWNAKINVISRKDIDALYDHHVLHSLAIARYLQLRNSGTKSPDFVPKCSSGTDMGTKSPDFVPKGLPEGSTVLDLGTGGGFPGIPLAILFPEAQFTLCDSVGKKIIVADAVAKALDLKNVTTVNARAESLGRDFDYVVSRAVASLEDFYPWVKGRFRHSILLLKGGEGLAEETARARARYHLPQGSLATWPIDSWLTDPWFSGKFVLEVKRG